ncbi:MAG: hypothetical protein HRU38_12085 [Saccharospirillaceae bacterium]|nr:hypothetical protein [Pseudomonadales bacterium]NRB79387.1 hypothetical protein [Saccharospirillaceae bacterium]
MKKYIALIILWPLILTISGLMLGIIFIGVSSGGLAVIIGYFGFLVGIIISFIHTFLLWRKDTNQHIKKLIPCYLVISIILLQLFISLFSNFNCQYSEPQARSIFIKTLQKHGKNPDHQKKGIKLFGCKYQFDIGGVLGFIVNNDGEVLNSNNININK